MEAGSHDREPGDGCPLAPIWVCNVLAGHFQRPPDSGPEKDFQGTRRSDLSDGGGELHLGRPTYSRRTSHARSRYLGTNDFPLDETSAERPRASKTLACLSSKSPGSDPAMGSLYRTDHHVRCALLLLHHRPRSEAYREFRLALSCNSNGDQAGASFLRWSESIATIPISTSTTSEIRKRCFPMFRIYRA